MQTAAETPLMQGRQAHAAPQKLEELNHTLAPALHAFSGEVSAAFAAVDGSGLWSYCAQDVLPTASTIKVFVLGAVLAACEQGRLSLSEHILLRKEDKIGGSGILCDLCAGACLPIRDVAFLMIAVSDNTATNLLIDAAGGVSAVQAHIEAAGACRTHLFRKLSEDAAVMEQCVLAESCAEDFVHYLVNLHTGKLLQPASVQIFDELLAKQRYKDFVPARMPLAEDWPECWPQTAGPVYAACKTGWMTGIRCDVGYLKAFGHEYAYAVMTNACHDLRPNAQNEAVQLLGEAGWQFYQAMRQE